MPLQLIHPAVVHFPIVFIISLLAVDSFALVKGVPLTGDTSLGRTSIVLAASAAIFAIIVYFFGDQAFDIALAAGTPDSILEPHVKMGTVTAAAIAVWGLLRGAGFWRGLSVQGGWTALVVLVEVVLVVMVLGTAFLGGQLVYDHGVAVSAKLGG